LTDLAQIAQNSLFDAYSQVLHVITQKLIFRLLLLAVLLPVALSVVLGTGHLLRSMDDLLWGNVLLRLALLGGIAWLVTLVLLLFALAARAACPSARPDIEEDFPTTQPMDKRED
tara:strand:+ start:1075 stop:1419 length:345 start_codon:yes stop_codon:yes gene_type:complete